MTDKKTEEKNPSQIATVSCNCLWYWCLFSCFSEAPYWLTPYGRMINGTGELWNVAVVVWWCCWWGCFCRRLFPPSLCGRNLSFLRVNIYMKKWEPSVTTLLCWSWNTVVSLLFYDFSSSAFLFFLDGTHTKPYLDREDTIYIFNPQLCRYIE